MVLQFLNKQLERVNEFTFFLTLLIILMVSAIYFHLQFSLMMNHNFLLVTSDTAAYQNTLVNLLHGNFFRDTAFEGPNLLGLHTFFILIFLMPIYAFYPDPDLLYFLQIVGVYSFVIPVFLVALDRLQNVRSAFVVGLSALMSPSLLISSCSPFHPENWIPPALFWSYYFYLKDRRTLFWYSLFFAFFCGEISAFVVASLGLALLATQEQDLDKRYGLRYLVAGIGWLIFTQVVVLPIMHSPDQQNMVAFKYPDWNANSPLGLLFSVLTQPLKAVALMFSPLRLFLYMQVFGLSVFLIPFFPRSLILMLPMPIFFLMSYQELFLDFHVYYFAYAYIAANISLILFLKECQVTSRLSVIVLSLILFWNVLDFAEYTSYYEAIPIDQDGIANAEILENLQKIPVEACVYGPHRYSAILSSRENMVMGDLLYDNDFNSMVEDRYRTTQVHADQIDFIVCDTITDQTGRRISVNKADSEKRLANIQALIKSGKWRLVWGSREKQFIILCRADRKYQ